MRGCRTVPKISKAGIGMCASGTLLCGSGGFVKKTMEANVKQRLLDLANTCYQNGHYTFTHFLGLAELDEFYRMEKEISFVKTTLYGGSDFAERKILRFGDEEMFGYAEEFPIACIQCLPLTPKFAEQPGHRDVLGALMNLGIERDVIGDIWVKEKEAYFFCLANMKDYICENLSKIRHTNVICTEMAEIPEQIKPSLKQEEYLAASERCDAILSQVYHLSRSKCIPLFREKKVFINGRQAGNNSVLLKDSEVVSVRGYGRFVYRGIVRETKKGKLTVKIERYV